MKRKQLICFMAICTMLAGLHPIKTQAAQMNSEQTHTEQELGDGYEIVENYNTAKTADTSCFLTVETICPKGFGLNTYVILMDELGNTYRISISSENGYVGQIYLAPGTYQVTEVSVFDDYKQEYPFVIAEQEFSLSENENKTISFMMRDYAKIEKEIADRTDNTQKENTNQDILFSDSQLYETGLEGVLMQGTGTLYYTIEHHGIGAGIMEVCGHATGNYDVVVKIVKGGVLGEAVFQISLDGGKTFIGQDVVSDISKIGDAGITLYFKTEQDTVEFVQGDEYHVKVPETFQTIASKATTANLIVMGHPLEEHEFIVTILSSGGLGNSRFTVESTKGTTIDVTDVIPVNGIYELEDDITLIFSDSEAYERGLTYSVTIDSNDDTINYTPIYILFGILITGGTIVISAMGSKKESDKEYCIRKYQWRKDEQEYDK